MRFFVVHTHEQLHGRSEHPGTATWACRLGTGALGLCGSSTGLELRMWAESRRRYRAAHRGVGGRSPGSRCVHSAAQHGWSRRMGQPAPSRSRRVPPDGLALVDTRLAPRRSRSRTDGLRPAQRVQLPVTPRFALRTRSSIQKHLRYSGQLPQPSTAASTRKCNTGCDTGYPLNTPERRLRPARHRSKYSARSPQVAVAAVAFHRPPQRIICFGNCRPAIKAVPFYSVLTV